MTLYEMILIGGTEKAEGVGRLWVFDSHNSYQMSYEYYWDNSGFLDFSSDESYPDDEFLRELQELIDDKLVRLEWHGPIKEFMAVIACANTPRDIVKMRLECP